MDRPKGRRATSRSSHQDIYRSTNFAIGLIKTQVTEPPTVANAHLLAYTTK